MIRLSCFKLNELLNQKLIILAYSNIILFIIIDVSFIIKMSIDLCISKKQIILNIS